MTVELIAELATGHGGDVDLACDMVAAAADSGAHTVKIQSYSLAALNPRDPQADWLRQAHLSEADHERVIATCAKRGVQFLSTPCDREALLMLQRLRHMRIKVATTRHPWSLEGFWLQVKSWAWGRKPEGHWPNVEAHLTAIPLYPAPLEALAAVPLLDGYSDHTVGTVACQHMISRGATIIEAHFCLPGRSRQLPFDKTPEQFRAIRDYADAVETMTVGIAAHFRERWTA